MDEITINKIEQEAKKKYQHLFNTTTGFGFLFSIAPTVLSYTSIASNFTFINMDHHELGLISFWVIAINLIFLSKLYIAERSYKKELKEHCDRYLNIHIGQKRSLRGYNDRNPFKTDEDDHVIEITDIKNGYVQYQYTFGGSKQSKELIRIIDTYETIVLDTRTKKLGII